MKELALYDKETKRFNGEIPIWTGDTGTANTMVVYANENDREHLPLVLKRLDDQGRSCFERGEYLPAELFYKRALSIREKELGPNHPDVATSLNNVALVCAKEGNNDEALKLYTRAWEIREKALGPNSPAVSDSRAHMAALYYAMGNAEEAKQLLARNHNPATSKPPDTSVVKDDPSED
jgi:tetratricopeptide (TPR) repeat protein